MPSKQRRKLTEDELNVRKVGDRTLSDEEVNAGRLLIKTPLTEEARANNERQLASMEEVDKLHGQEQVEAMGEFISDQVDRAALAQGENHKESMDMLSSLNCKVDALISSSTSQPRVSTMLDSSLVEPIDAMPEYMHEPLKTCGLAGRGLRLYCTALRSLIDDPPLVGYIDLRSMCLRTLTKLACKCSIPVKSAVRWEHCR